MNSNNKFSYVFKDNAKSSLNPRPLPMPKELIGTDYYYKLRHIDAENRGIKPPDYYKEYGDKYLHKFKYETRPNLSEGGKKWCDDTLVNLQKSMEKTLEKNPEIEKDNKKFRESAFDSHPDAYLKAGFWEKTSWNDKKEIGWTPDFKDLFKPEGIKQVVEMVKKAPIENIVKEMIK